MWQPQFAPRGPVVLIVSLPQQWVHVYRNGVRIGVATVSTGKRGYETKTGVYDILERKTEHFSNLYDNAPMPYMLRLTWSGTALHAGHLPGYPASHGCIRQPKTFAELLFDTVQRGTVVVIADATSHPPDVVSPGWLTPVDPATGAVRNLTDIPETEFWAPERALEGPLSLLLSTADQRLVVVRNGVEIGHARAMIDGDVPAGTDLYVLQSVIPEHVARRQMPPTLIATHQSPAPVPILHWRTPTAPPAQPTADPNPLPLRGGELHLSESFARQLHEALLSDVRRPESDPAGTRLLGADRIETRLIVSDTPLRPAPPALPAAPPAQPAAPPALPAAPPAQPAAPPALPTAPPVQPAAPPEAEATPVTPLPQPPPQTPTPDR